MKNTDDEERLGDRVRAVGPDTTPSADFRDALRQRVVAAMNQSMAAAERPHRFRGRIIKLFAAAAAVCVLAIAGWWLVGGGASPASAGFEQMLKRLAEVKTVEYELVWRAPGQADVRVKIQLARPGHVRVTFPDGRDYIFDHARDQCLRLSSGTKSASLTRAYNDLGYDLLDKLQNAHASSGHYVGTETVAGRKASVYDVSRPGERLRVWVDSEQELPLRIEFTSGPDAGEPVAVMLDSFRWNTPIPDSSFALDIPEGYALDQATTQPTEGSLLELLRAVADLSSETYPEVLDAKAAFDLVCEDQRKKHGYQGPVDAATVIDFDDQAKETFKACLRGLAFIEQIQKTGTWEYLGKGVRLGDATSPVCRYRSSGSDEFRTIYGDLRSPAVRSRPTGN